MHALTLFRRELRSFEIRYDPGMQFIDLEQVFHSCELDIRINSHVIAFESESCRSNGTMPHSPLHGEYSAEAHWPDPHAALCSNLTVRGAVGMTRKLDKTYMYVLP